MRSCVLQRWKLANVGSRVHRFASCLFAVIGVSTVVPTVWAQTQMPMPAQTGTFSGNSRGYWFTAPTNFVITGVEVPTTASTGAQNVAVLRLNAVPPAFSANTNDFTQLLLTQNGPTSGIIPAKIAVSTNDLIGVLGDRAGINSYSNVGNTTTIDGNSVALTRLGMQFPLSTTAPQQIWQEASSNISRVWLYYQPGFLVSGVANPIAGGSVTCSPDIVAANATTTCTVTPNAGYSVSQVSGCGVTATSPPYTTAPATAHCTVTATFVEGATVGGTVSGLSGSGFALSLNGTETLPIGANGAFTFTSRVTSGNTYAVTVQTQPNTPSQTCTVANGSGTAGASNVTNVTVTCATNTYTVGGTISGLSGSGMVLSLNGGAQTLSPSANGTFTFPTSLASGSAYAVTVQTQPSSPAQTCSVASGNGTVTSANVTTVTVSCSTNAYTVGGTVAGLSGTGMVLSLNGGAQTLNVASNGSFTFPTAIASGSAYTVTVQTQPSSPAQACTVSNGSGTVASGNVTNIAVQCGAQQRIVTLSSSLGNVSATPPIPASVDDGTVLSFKLNVPPGFALLGASGCGGTLSGSTYTTAPITANCTISVSLAAVAAQTVPMLNNPALVLLSLLLLGAAVLGRRRLRQ